MFLSSKGNVLYFDTHNRQSPKSLWLQTSHNVVRILLNLKFLYHIIFDMVKGLYLDMSLYLLQFNYSRLRRMSIYGRLKGQDSPYVERGPRRTHWRWDLLVMCILRGSAGMSTTNENCTAIVCIITAAAPSKWSGSYRHTVEGYRHHLVCQPTSPGIDARVYNSKRIISGQGHVILFNNKQLQFPYGRRV
jgi:hypothetical protein